MVEPLRPYGKPQDLFSNIFLEIISWDLSGSRGSRGSSGSVE
jgi:hypothetical protein